MAIIDWQAVYCGGMPGICQALHAIEARLHALEARVIELEQQLDTDSGTDARIVAAGSDPGAPRVAEVVEDYGHSWRLEREWHPIHHPANDLELHVDGAGDIYVTQPMRIP